MRQFPKLDKVHMEVVTVSGNKRGREGGRERRYMDPDEGHGGYPRATSTSSSGPGDGLSVVVVVTGWRWLYSNYYSCSTRLTGSG